MVSAYNLLDSYDTTTMSAQNVQVIAITPWLMIPAIPVIVANPRLQLPGGGIRDAPDPYSQYQSPT